MQERQPRISADCSRSSDVSSRAPLIHGGVTRRVLRAFYDVYNELGYGFLESVYRNALLSELRERGARVETEAMLVQGEDRWSLPHRSSRRELRCR